MVNDTVTEKEKEFLRESNYIEGEFSEKALDQAIEAWEFFRDAETSVESLLECHRILMREKLAERYVGDFRDCTVSIGGRVIPYISHAYFKDELSRLFEDMYSWEEITEEFSKGCHVRFEMIHPFVDGNGRVGRMLYNKQRIDHGLDIHVIYNAEKRGYYKWFDEVEKWLHI